MPMLRKHTRKEEGEKEDKEGKEGGITILQRASSK